MFTIAFWRAAAERALKTAAQVLLVFLGADVVNVFKVDWGHALGITLGAALLSVLMSMASAQVGPEKGTPSLVGEPPPTA